MIGPSGSAVVLAMAYLFAGFLLAGVLITGLALLLIGACRQQGRRLRSAGWRVLLVWCVPAAAWGYLWLVLNERDQYRTLIRPEIIYGVPLPAGSTVNYRKWERRVQWATLPSHQRIQGIEYSVQVNFCGRMVCSATLARDRVIDGFPCRGGEAVAFSRSTGRLTDCTLSSPLLRDGAVWPAGTVVVLGDEPGSRYILPAGAEPVEVRGVQAHSGLIVQFGRDGRVREIERNESRAHPDTRLEIDGIVLRLAANGSRFDFTAKGEIEGGVLAMPAVVNGQPFQAGDAVVVHLRPPR